MSDEPEVIEIRPHRGGWQVCEGPGVQPYYLGDGAIESALSYARERMRSRRRGEIRVVNAAGEVQRQIKFERGDEVAP